MIKSLDHVVLTTRVRDPDDNLVEISVPVEALHAINNP